MGTDRRPHVVDTSAFEDDPLGRMAAVAEARAAGHDVITDPDGHVLWFLAADDAEVLLTSLRPTALHDSRLAPERGGGAAGLPSPSCATLTPASPSPPRT